MESWVSGRKKEGRHGGKESAHRKRHPYKIFPRRHLHIEENPSTNYIPGNLSTTPAAAAAKSLQSCLTLCNSIEGSPPGSPVPGILQARTLEWVAISFSNAWDWKVKMKSFSRVRLLVTPWTAARQAPPSTGFSRQEYWSGLPLPSPNNPREGANSQRAFWRAGENIVCVFITSYQPYCISTLQMPAACKLLKILLHPHFPELWTQSTKEPELFFIFIQETESPWLLPLEARHSDWEPSTVCTGSVTFRNYLSFQLNSWSVKQRG